ncbi:MAG: FtsK/SpoIIIE domain-containing protein [Rhodococcus sp. (in: high G+C Gram-positive bacteria)]|uniref:FtsK/SpoIIIE domain-containing protein n=1 Tax=unclassified Rhodococcus (in: high G+C Gram-positive bacteria) TaxID=192944 RepID=UPI000E487FBB|nr:FtsK/SpoIIIE domain-containing protein [Rhodococcus sp. WY5]MDZ7912988.1 FtsK/SpoIIIE domain-containing protein [Rhodococcus sp. (in: high G+C Gram-positive bacteria)]RGP46529.1 hypothetical protein AWH04_03970 [Rhodococcus erythropolis]
MRDNTAMKKKARARAQATGEKYVTAQKQIAAQAPEPVAPRFPTFATLPSPTRIPTSVDEASEMYPTFRMQLGIDESGDIVGVDLAKNPHALFFGVTGSGKSVLTRTVIESCRSAGWMLFLCDGKGTDYEGLHRQPGIVAISQRTADHMRMVRMVADELRGRQADAWARRQAGERGPFPCPPLLLLLDEYATIRASIRDVYGTDFHEFDSDVQLIARIGREFRVHVIVATQDPSPRAIPAPLLENLSTRVALGPSDNAAACTAFPYPHRATARRIIESFGSHARGRGLVAFTGEDGGSRIVEIQTFIGYTPGDAKRAPGGDADVTHNAHEVSNKVPSLYPRLWFQVDGPHYGQPLSALYACPTVALDRPDGTPDPDMEQYDPLHPSYLGAADAFRH